MSVPCVVCYEPTRRMSAMCGNCLQAKDIIQRSASVLMDLHGVPAASGMCVECKKRRATCRDHRHYSRPLEVDSVCLPCNRTRGFALDLFALIKQHRGITVAKETPAALPEQLPGDLERHLEEYERRLIMTALTVCHFNRTAAAKRLGITFRAMRYRLERLGISY